MVSWFGKHKKKEGSDLKTPLLGNEYIDPTSDTTPNSPISPSQPQVITAAEALAVQNNYDRSTRRRSSQRLQKRLSRTIDRRQSNLSRQTSDASSLDNGDVTHRVNDLHSFYERKRSTSFSYGQVESDVTDYQFSFDDENGHVKNDSSGDAEKGVSREPMTPGAMAKSAAVLLVTTTGIVSYSAAFVASAMGTLLTTTTASAATTMVGVAGGVCLLTVPLVWVSEWRLTHIPTIRKSLTHLSQLVEQYREEAEILIMLEEDLRAEVEILQESNKHFEHILEDNGGNVDELLALVQENENVLRQMKENTRQVVLQDVVKLVLRSDMDHDGIISKTEGNILAKRLSLSLNIYGIVFDEQKFHRAIGLSPSLPGVMAIVKRLLPDEHDRLSSFYYVDRDSADEVGVDEKEDVYDMFYFPLKEEVGKRMR